LPTLVPLLAALAVGLLAPPDHATVFPAAAEVSAAALEVFDEPDERSYSSGRLRRGDRVTVRDADRAGWIAIDPPADAFDWVERGALGPEEPGRRARVVASGAVARSGRLGARMPGPPRAELREGSLIRLADLPPLVVGAGPSATTWLAIVPPPGEVRHVRVQGVRWVAEPPSPVAETRASFNPPSSPADPLPNDVATAIARIEAIHRAELRAPVETWQMGPIRARYQALLKTVTDPASAKAVHDRLERVARHEEIAEAAREIQTILERSRRRDDELARVRKRLAAAHRPERRPFDAEGLVQSSSRQVEGKRVLALIGPEGTTLAYLDVPDGLDARPLLAQRVGVRGDVHYNEHLRASLITVRSVEPLE
jgi:hypothetical protein